MLSFLRNKLSDGLVDNIITGTENLSMQPKQQHVTDAKSQNLDTSLNGLGYKDETELKETLYGIWLIDSNDLI